MRIDNFISLLLKGPVVYIDVDILDTVGRPASEKLLHFALAQLFNYSREAVGVFSIIFVLFGCLQNEDKRLKILFC